MHYNKLDLSIIKSLTIDSGSVDKTILDIKLLDKINTRISRRVTIVTRCHNCDAVCHNCDILFVKMLELGSEIIPKN